MSAIQTAPGPVMRRRRLGADLRQLRVANALRLEEVADHLGVAPSTLSRIETGKAPTRTSYLMFMLDLYGVDDLAQRRMFMDMAREGQRKGWWIACDDVLPAGAGSYLGLEAEASALMVYQALAVPGLVRTPEYARALIIARRPRLPAEDVDRLVSVDMRRQDLVRGDHPIALSLILDEAVLLRVIGSQAVMRGQLARLIEAGREPTVTIQVLRLDGPPSRVVTASFGVLSFADAGDADVVCAEGMRGQIQLEQRTADVAAMRVTFEELSKLALPPAESAELIRHTAGLG